MTYIVEATNEHTLGVLRSLQEAGILIVREEQPKTGKQRTVTREQQSSRILNSIREGLEQVNRLPKNDPARPGSDELTASH